MSDTNDNVHILYYSSLFNKFTDEDWCIIHDLYELFDTWQLDQWKKTENHGTIVAKNGEVWNLYYLSDDEDDDLLDFIGWQQEGYNIQMDRPCY